MNIEGCKKGSVLKENKKQNGECKMEANGEC